MPVCKINFFIFICKNFFAFYQILNTFFLQSERFLNALVLMKMRVEERNSSYCNHNCFVVCFAYLVVFNRYVIE